MAASPASQVSRVDQGSRGMQEHKLPSRLEIGVILATLFLCGVPRLCAQDTAVTPGQQVHRAPEQSAEADPPTLFPHPETDRWWISGQANFISQWHPAFHSPYQGPRSLPPQAQDATSRVLTLFTGVRLTGTDTSFQFMNWTVDNNGAYDYAADTRGFTFAAMLEY